MKLANFVSGLSLLFLPVFFMTLPVSFSTHPTFLTPVSAREDEEEDREEEEDDEDEDDDSESSAKQSAPKTKTIKVIKEVIEYRPVTETIIVTEEAYAKDADGDTLVDAIDPDPLVPQSEYFTDQDDDGIPNALDRHHDEDDFAYYDFETDTNENGILDSYEE